MLAPSDYLRLEHSNPQHANWIVVNWCVGNTCNYACSYCPDELHDRTKPWTSLEIAKNFSQSVLNHYGRARQFYFEFTGGEVSLWPDFLELAEFLRGKDVRVGIISNGSRSLDWWEKARGFIDHACLSFHPEAANAEHFMEVVRSLTDRCRTHINFMMLPEKFDFCYSLARAARSLPHVSMALQPLIKDFQTDLFEYSEPQLSILERQHELLAKDVQNIKPYEYYRGSMVKVSRDGGRTKQASHRFISMKENNWHGWTCNAGLEQIVVGMDGNIYRGWCQVGGRIGNIADPKIEFPTAAVTCSKSMCHCNADIMTSKFRTEPSVLSQNTKDVQQ